MEFSLILAALALLQLSAATAHRTQRESPCVDGVHIIATRGDSRKEPPYGGLTTTVHNITAAIAHSNAEPNPYPLKDPVPLQAITEGTHSLKRLVHSYVKRCPKTRIVLAGYSEGAVIMMNVMCGFSALGVDHITPLEDKYAHNIIAAIGYGDESRRAGETYNRGTCLRNGIRPRKMAQCGPFHDKIRSFCDASDPLCCRGGTDPNQHFQYPNQFDHTSTIFVEDKFRIDP